MRINASSVARLLASGLLIIGIPSAGQTQGAPRGSVSVAGEVGPRSYTSKLDPLAIG